MLVYNHNKELVGIQQDVLKSLGLNSLRELEGEVDDFSDFFIDEPGFVHNFKHMHWIDYVICNEGNESRVALEVKGKRYNGYIDIKPMMLSQEPELQGYAIYIQGIKQALSAPTSFVERSQPKVDLTPKVELAPEVDLTPKVEIHQEPKVAEPKVAEPKVAEPKIIETKTVEPKLDIKLDTPEYDEKDFSTYKYDPQQAAEELKIPVDLVEEFIGDFIAQADEYKIKIYNHLENSDLSNVKILAHKLKGVAANLRVEDAFEALSIINTSSDLDEIKLNLDNFYVSMAKLANKPLDELEPRADVLDIDLDVFEQTPAVEEKTIEPKKPEYSYDFRKAAEEIGLDVDTLRDLYLDYLAQAKEITADLKICASQEDYKTAAGLAHKFKSMNLNMRIDIFDKELDAMMREEARSLEAHHIASIEHKLSELTKRR